MIHPERGDLLQEQEAVKKPQPLEVPIGTVFHPLPDKPEDEASSRI